MMLFTDRDTRAINTPPPRINSRYLPRDICEPIMIADKFKSARSFLQPIDSINGIRVYEKTWERSLPSFFLSSQPDSNLHRLERIGKRKKENSLENISETSSRFIVVHPRRLEEKPRWRSKAGTKEERMNQDGR